MIKILIGGSPCTYWSVAQKKNREVEAEGLGWELFKNYLIAKEKFKPDFFLYENNKSAAQAIKDQISRELGVELIHINSALVSAQNRQRFYAFNWSVEQPEDRGILVGDILDTHDGEILYKLEHVAKNQAYCVACRGRYKTGTEIGQHLEPRTDGKTNTLTTVTKDNLIAQPIRLGDIQTPAQAHRVYSAYGKSVNITANGGGQGAKTGLYMCPVDLTRYTLEKDKYHVVEGGKIETRYGVQEINLPDGAYIIRKLTPVECERLQTLPDGYTAAVSNTQRYKGLGNGWTAEVIIHILNGALKDVPRDEKIIVLSMYDGIGTGRYCLEKMGFTNVTYYAYEIDEPAMKVALSNYPDIIEMGDAFALRDDGWELGKKIQPAEAVTADEEKMGETTDISDAPGEIKREIIENAETLEARETHEEPKPQERTESSGPTIPFNATEQLRKLAAERRALANIHPDTDRFTNDILAIEYAVSILEAMAI